MHPMTSYESLTRLLSNMKRSFLPRTEETVFRQVILSDAGKKDPMILVKYDEDAILIGSGFHAIAAAGRSYDAFPDIRLPYSERDNLRAWILLDEAISPKTVFPILKALGFPALYATRNIIAKFRDFLVTSEDLEKCRFFELFSDSAEIRNIGSIECFRGEFQGKACMTLRAEKTSVTYTHIALEGNAQAVSGHVLGIQNDAWNLSGTDIQTGEVLHLTEKEQTKLPLKFTFDTFYFDDVSVGVEAGYIFADRKSLSEGGVLVFTLKEDARIRAISGHIFIDSRGFLHSHEILPIHKEILKAIRMNYEEIVTKNPRVER